MNKIATPKWKNFDSFVRLVIAYSPEHVHRDGEASKTEVKKTIARLNREWKQLEKLEGKKVTEDEIWEAFLEARRSGGETIDTQTQYAQGRAWWSWTTFLQSL